MNNFATVLEQLKQDATNSHEQGGKFERLIKSYLSKDPIYADRFSNVWLWSEWPERSGPDTGIDLVAKEKSNGGLCAIQCKFYDPKHTLQKSDIDSFFTASGKKIYTHRLIVSTTDKWSKHAEEAIKDQRIPCERLRFQDLDKVIHNWDAAISQPAKLRLKQQTKTIRPHQQDAVNATLDGFKKVDRGKLIMACGTGKTFTSLRITEAQVKGGLTLFIVPSLSLLSQAMREWMYEKDQSIKSKYIAVCSDTKVGKDDDDISLVDLPWPATTDYKSLVKQLEFLKQNYDNIIVFSTYQSLEVISKAQKSLQKSPNLKPKESVFDLVICDEAHRTTGIESSEGKVSLFSKVHSNDFIQAHKRLYMTATPRLYSSDSKRKAKERSIGVYSMDDNETYGEEFYRLDFSQAVSKGLLSDYKVLILSVSEKYIAGPLQHLITNDGQITIPDAAKIIGCWNGLRYPEGKTEKKNPLRRAVAFSSSIEASELIASEFARVVQSNLEETPLPKGEYNLNCEVKHVDGGMNILERNQKLDWLRDEPTAKDGKLNCRILSNVRCLSEGIDVPALDAVMFLQPKASQVDIVQAVGRVMRKSEGKDYGYIILPITVAAGIPPNQALDDDKKYSAVWGVLQALRSHDEKFNAIINQLELNQEKPDKIKSMHIGEKGELVTEDQAQETSSSQLGLDFHEWHNAIYAKIVDRCGDRGYWESWAQDVARIAQTITARIEGLLDKKNSEFYQIFSDFLLSLQKNINPAIGQEEAVSLLSQHTITRPVFDALFEDYVFSKHNPVSISMEKVLSYLKEAGLENEIKNLKGFYDSVRDRASGIDNIAGKQKVMTELYEKFFATAFPKVAEKLGIVYTPIEVVDFILRSANEVLRQEFNQGLSDKDVHILDPFTGTGSFLVRLLQNKELINDKDLKRKFNQELHANEIMLLAYYIAAINIEEAFQQRMGGDYKPFDGVVLTDTFQMSEGDERQGRLDKLFPVNSKRVEEQKKNPIRVIIGNPPWSAGQKSENDANKNLKYENLDKRIKATYVKHSSATLRNSLYDSYIRAIRWASDRIGKEGVVAYVTNGSFIDGNASDGLRKCLVEEFERIYCFNLRGNARTSGDLNKKEGGLLFNKGRGSKATIAITLLVKNPKRKKAGEKGEILYHDIGDYMNREAKLEKISSHSLSNLHWQEITPNALQDWINQRDPAFESYMPMGTDEAKKAALNILKGKESKSDQLFSDSDLLHEYKGKYPIVNIFFGIYSRGVATSRDAWAYNFSQAILQANMKQMISFYNEQVAEYQKAKHKNPKLKVDDFISNDHTKISWDGGIKDDLSREKQGKYIQKKIRQAIYRPFCKQWLYYDQQFNNRHYRTPLFFPQPDTKNLLICVSGKGANQSTTLMVDILLDLNMLEAGTQSFPLYVYDEQGKRHDNISDSILALFQEEYKTKKINKEDIFYYIYGVLHWPAYRKSFASDLVKMLPRIPFVAAKNFSLFVEAGRGLGKLHVGYEQVKKYPIKIISSSSAKHDIAKMSFAKDPSLKSESNKQGFDKSTIIYNSTVQLQGIPKEAYDYVVNGKSAIEWIMERYQMKIDKDSGIRNNPNDWSSGGKYILSLLRRVITVSVESVRIVKQLEKVKN